MSLVELMVGLAIASIVAAVVMAGAAATATQVRRELAAARLAEGPRDVLAAMLADVRRDPAWSACLTTVRCPAYVGRSYGVALVANTHAWAIHDGGLRVCSKEHCELALGGVTALQVWVDAEEGGFVRRDEISHAPEGRLRRVEIRIWLTDGSRRSRSTWLGP
jgi:hypothetical protein